MAIVYVTTNKLTGTRYLGKKVKDRPSYLGSGIYLQHSIKKYRRENFHKQILCVVEKDEAARIERELSFLWNVFNDREKWYNLRPGGNGGSAPGSLVGRKLSEETKNKISMANKGLVRSIEACRKISESRKGRKFGPLSEEHKRKCSLSKIGNTWNRGVPKSEETKAKIRESHKRRKS